MTQMTITSPLMTILDEDGSQVPDVSRSITEAEAMEKASSLPAGTYYLNRPTSTIIVSAPSFRPPGAIAYSAPGDEIKFNGGLEDDDWREEIHDDEPYHSEAASVVPDPIDKQYNAIRMYWGRDWPLRGGNIRSELKRPNNVQLHLGVEYITRVGVFIADTPANVALVNTDLINCHCLQWHYETGTSGINLRYGQWQFSFGMLGEKAVAPIILGQWNNWEIRAKVADDDTGYCLALLNGVPVYFEERVITADGILNPKMGIYYGLPIFDSTPELQGIEYLYRQYSITRVNIAGHYGQFGVQR